MIFYIKNENGRDAGKIHKLVEGENLAGRSRAAQIRLLQDDVSGRQCIITLDEKNEKVTIKNISSYGTKVNGTPLGVLPLELAVNDVIEVGKTLKLTFAKSEAEPDAGFDPAGEEYPEQDAMSYTFFLGETQMLQSKKSMPPDTPNGSKPSTGTSSPEYDTSDSETDITAFMKSSVDTPAPQPSSQPPPSPAPGQQTNQIPEEHGENETLPVTDEKSSGTENDTASLEETAFLPPDDEDDNEEEEASHNITDPNETEFTKLEQDNFFAAKDDSAPHTAFFDDDEEEDKANQTHANETMLAQTRMASMDEINFIKSQIKKQQQSRLFFKFMLFILIAVLLGVVWILRAPQHEKTPAWPTKQGGGFSTGSIEVFNKGYAQGGFDIYYPMWEIPGFTEVDTNSPDLITIKTRLGKKADVPLTITLQRETSNNFVYETREDAIQNAQNRLREDKNNIFNFDRSNIRTFLVANNGEGENGIVCDTTEYQRQDASKSYYGVMRFFRHANTNYILRAETPVEERLRVKPLLMSDTFMTVHINFVRRHWEGDDEYRKGANAVQQMEWIKPELNRNSPMQMPRLEIAIKSILAQALYSNDRTVYSEAMDLLLTLRSNQQRWYKMQKVKWFSASRKSKAQNTPEKLKIRNESEAVFTIKEDKRNNDIQRGIWE